MKNDYESLKKADHEYLWHPFTQMQEWMREDPCIIERGEGSYLVDVNGRRLLDGISSLWCNMFGHRRPELDRALKEQADRIAHSTFLGLTHVPGIRLAQRLVEIAPAGLRRVFYADAGANAVEVALKLAMQYWYLKGEQQRTRFACLEEAYHGDTVGAMSVGYSETFHRFHRSFLVQALTLKPPYVHQRQSGLSESEACKRALEEATVEIGREKDRLVALIMEPVMQGAAGMWPQPAGYVKGLRSICDENGILMIADEVATGFGHTGRMFACEHENVTPDLLCVGKGITGGYLPMSATLATEEVFAAFLGEYDEFKSFFHGHTYTGNPLACAVALATLDIFENEAIIEKIQPKIRYLEWRMNKDLLPMKHVREIRQRGFMTGIELVEDKARDKAYAPKCRMAHQVVLAARARGVIIRPLGDTLIMLPPLSISNEELETLVDVVQASIAELTERS